MSETSARGRLHEVHVDLEVPFHDVDVLQIVWHGHYYKYMELGRTALLRARGLARSGIAGDRGRSGTRVCRSR